MASWLSENSTEKGAAAVSGGQKDCAKCIFSEQHEFGLFCVPELRWVHGPVGRNDEAECCELYTTEADAIAYGRELVEAGG